MSELLPNIGLDDPRWQEVIGEADQRLREAIKVLSERTLAVAAILKVVEPLTPPEPPANNQGGETAAGK